MIKIEKLVNLKINQRYYSAHISCLNIEYIDILLVEHIGHTFIFLF